MAKPVDLSFETTVKGNLLLQKELDGLEKKVQRKVMAKSSRAGAKIVADDAKRDAPEGEEGRLKRGIKVRTAKGNNGKRLRKYVGHAAEISGVRFASFVFLGTKYITGSETLREALYTNASRVQQIYRATLTRGLNEIARESKAKNP